MELSLAGLIGAALGTIVSAATYGRLIDAIEERLRNRRVALDDRATFAQEIALLRRGILAADLLVCAGLGYWIGLTIGG
jgi:predicted DNA-binding transcriptional regulator